MCWLLFSVQMAETEQPNRTQTITRFPLLLPSRIFPQTTLEYNQRIQRTQVVQQHKTSESNANVSIYCLNKNKILSSLI